MSMYLYLAYGNSYIVINNMSSSTTNRHLSKVAIAYQHKMFKRKLKLLHLLTIFWPFSGTRIRCKPSDNSRSLPDHSLGSNTLTQSLLARNYGRKTNWPITPSQYPCLELNINHPPFFMNSIRIHV